MKREFLKGLGIEGLTDEAIEKIMSEAGKDIETTKQKITEKYQPELENLQSEIESKDKMLGEVNSQIEKFKGMDVEGIQKQAEEWKNKYTEFENQTKAEKEAFAKQLADQEYDFKVKEFTGQHKFTNDFVKNAFVEDFKKQGFKLDGEKFLGADDYIKSFSEKNPGVFVVESTEPKAPELNFAAPTGGQVTNEPANPFGFKFNTLHDTK